MSKITAKMVYRDDGTHVADVTARVDTPYDSDIGDDFADVFIMLRQYIAWDFHQVAMFVEKTLEGEEVVFFGEPIGDAVIEMMRAASEVCRLSRKKAKEIEARRSV